VLEGAVLDFRISRLGDPICEIVEVNAQLLERER
jgi:hypothetical protein